ncbi:MAG: chemotaxis protein CheA [Oscillospiraceae bacterium]
MGRFEAGMESMVDMYIYESTSLLEQLDQILLRTESNNRFVDEDINEIFRIMHTIKGSSAMMGLENMSVLAHSIEDMFFILREEKPKIGSAAALYELVFAASDLLKAEIDLLSDETAQATDFSAQIAKIEDYVKLLKNGGVPAEAPAQAAAAAQPAAAGLTTVRVFFEDGCEMENLRALLLINKIRDECDVLQFTPADIETNPATAKVIVENGFLISFKATDDEKIVFSAIENALNVKSYEIEENAPQPVAEAPKPVPGKKKKAEKKPAQEAPPPPAEEEKKDVPAQSVEQLNSLIGAKNAGKQSLISVNLNKLDLLLDMVGEIVIAEAMVVANPDLKNLKLDNFQKASRQLRKLTDELQDIVMSIRMVPISGAFSKMTRIVRDMKIKLNKDVDLVFEGEETEVDKSVIDVLNDPLMHMVRNSMDHGIEDDPAERIAKGKPEKGTITLSAYNASSEVIIVVGDDGAGVNTEKVLAKAKKQGMLTKDESEYSDKEIFNMIMLPGFSTNEAVTEFSGRGVGMDVVRKNIEKIGGTVSVDSKWGEGTSFIIKIPLSLAIVDGIEVAVGSSIFTVPINVVRESFKLTKSQLIYDTSGNEMIKLRGECFPLIRLHKFFDVPDAKTDAYDAMVMVVESEGKSACFLVDKLLGEQQVVVKPFSPLLSRFNVKQNGMAGCTILGDGSITIILDISNILLGF